MLWKENRNETLCAARGLENLRKPGIGKRRELVQDDRKHRFIRVPVARRLRIALADHQLNVL